MITRNRVVYFWDRSIKAVVQQINDIVETELNDKSYVRDVISVSIIADNFSGYQGYAGIAVLQLEEDE